jgi:osmotically-inducible protein OsmY
MKSDSVLQHEIQEELARLYGSGADEIDIQVLAGVVTLRGNVRSDWEKWGVEDAVRRNEAVKGWRDETLVAPSEPGKEPDADIARGWFP